MQQHMRVDSVYIDLISCNAMSERLPLHGCEIRFGRTAWLLPCDLTGMSLPAFNDDDKCFSTFHMKTRSSNLIK